jgi:hypothetical protein
VRPPTVSIDTRFYFGQGLQLKLPTIRSRTVDRVRVTFYYLTQKRVKVDGHRQDS